MSEQEVGPGSNYGASLEPDPQPAPLATATAIAACFSPC